MKSGYRGKLRAFSLSMLHCRQRDRGWILLGMMDRRVRHHALNLIVVIAAGIHISVEAREITPRDFNANVVAGVKVVAGIHWLQYNFVYFALLHPGERLVVAVAIAQSLNGFVQVVRRAVG